MIEKLRCSVCGEKISVVLYNFTLVRYGTPYCYSCMKQSNRERKFWKQEIKRGKLP